jgi:hypothetical protein
MDSSIDPARMREIFTAYYRERHWGGPECESASGYGSTVDATSHLRRELAILMRELQVKHLLDIPCGDFNWMRHVDLAGIEYIGGDLVEPLVASNNARFGAANISFRALDVVSSELPRSDLVVCRDCMIHLPFAAVWDALRNMRRSGSTWVLLTHFSWKGFGPNVDAEVGGWHRLNFELPPFEFPTPAAAIVEGCEAKNCEDKMLALYRLDQLPLD